MFQGGDSTSDPNRATTAYGQSVFEYEPKSRTVEAFERLVTEIIEQMVANEGPWRPFFPFALHLR